MLSRIPFVVSALTSVCFADQLQAPMRMRVSSALVKQVFHSGDQKILDNFTDLAMAEPITKVSDEHEWGLQSLSASVKPKSVAYDDYDFVMSMKDPVYDQYLGIIGEDLVVTGHGTKLDGSEFEYQADLLKF